jgi:hypothetical protein
MGVRRIENPIQLRGHQLLISRCDGHTSATASCQGVPLTVQKISNLSHGSLGPKSRQYVGWINGSGAIFEHPSAALLSVLLSGRLFLRFRREKVGHELRRQ